MKIDFTIDFDALLCLAQAKHEEYEKVVDECRPLYNIDLENGKLNDDVLSENDQLFQDLWRTYFKAICIKERMNPKKQLSDMPRRYWKYMTEKNSNR